MVWDSVYLPDAGMGLLLAWTAYQIDVAQQVVDYYIQEEVEDEELEKNIPEGVIMDDGNLMVALV